MTTANFAQLSAFCCPRLAKVKFHGESDEARPIRDYVAFFFTAPAVPGFGSDGGLHGVSEKAEGAKMFAKQRTASLFGIEIIEINIDDNSMLFPIIKELFGTQFPAPCADGFGILWDPLPRVKLSLLRRSWRRRHHRNMAMRSRRILFGIFLGIKLQLGHGKYVLLYTYIHTYIHIYIYISMIIYVYIYIDVGNSLENPKMQEHHLQMGDIMRGGCTTFRGVSRPGQGRGKGSSPPCS